MNIKKLIPALESLNQKDPIKLQKEEISKGILEAANAKPLVESLVSRKLGFPAIVYNPSMFRANKDDREDLKKIMGFTDNQVKSLLNTDLSKWKLGKPKPLVYLRKNSVVNKDKTLTIWNRQEGGKSTPKSMTEFSPPELFLKTFGRNDKKASVKVDYSKLKNAEGTKSEIFVPMWNKEIRGVAMLPISKATYIVVIWLRDDNTIFAFRMKADSFNSIFDIVDRPAKVEKKEKEFDLGDDSKLEKEKMSNDEPEPEKEKPEDKKTEEEKPEEEKPEESKSDDKEYYMNKYGLSEGEWENMTSDPSMPFDKLLVVQAAYFAKRERDAAAGKEKPTE